MTRFGTLLVVGAALLFAACTGDISNDEPSAIDLDDVPSLADPTAVAPAEGASEGAHQPEDEVEDSAGSVDPFAALPTADDTNDWTELDRGDASADREFVCGGVRHVASEFPPIDRDGVQLGNGTDSVTVTIRTYAESSGMGSRAVNWVDTVSLVECNPVAVTTAAGTQLEDLNFAAAVPEEIASRLDVSVEAATAWRTERRIAGSTDPEALAHTIAWSQDDVYVSVTGSTVASVRSDGSSAQSAAQAIAVRYAALVSDRLGGNSVTIAPAPAPASSLPAEDLPSPELGCTPEEIGRQGGRIVSAYEVSGGEVVGRCLGTEDDRLLTAWSLLRDVASNSDLSSVVLIAGYESSVTDTLAFAGPLFEDNQQFVIAVLLDAVEEDPLELRLTMVHELSHVLTQTPDQFDLTIDGGADCGWFNEIGCFLPGSLMAEWVDSFWTDQDLARLPRSGAADPDGGGERCLIDPTYLGSYAASHPEEDFAETLSAFVFDVDVPPELSPKLEQIALDQRFVAMRDRARVQGITDLPNNFEPCG